MKRFLGILLAVAVLFSLVTVPAYAAAVPTLNTVSASGTAVTLQWSSVTGASAYYVYMGTSSGSLTYQKGTTALSTTVTGLTAGGTYYFGIKAKVDGVNSALSNVRSVTLTAAAPAITKMESAGAGSVKLTWNAVSGAQGYYVYQGTSAAQLTYVKGTTATSCTLTGLTQGTTYYFAMKVKTAAGMSAQSPAQAYTAAVSLTAPKLLKAELNGSSVTLTWQAAPGASGYYVYSGADASCASYRGYASGTTYTVTGLTAGTAYAFGIRSRQVNGSTTLKSDLSNVLFVTLPPAVPVLTGVALEDDTTVVLTWKSVDRAEGYYVYSGLSERTVATYAGYASGTTIKVSGLQPGRTYWFGVCSRKNAQPSPVKSALSNLVSVTMPTGAPAVMLIGVEQESSDTVRLEWNTAQGANGYYLYYGTAENAVGTYAGYVSGTSGTISGLRTGVTYWFGVRSRKVLPGTGETVKGELSNVLPLKLGNLSGTEGLQYSAINETTCKVTGYTGTETEVIIPANWTDENGKKRQVVSIAGSAFRRKSLTSVVIPGSVTSIGDYAFDECSDLTGVSIGPGLVTIGADAFSNCGSLTAIVLPDTVTTISNYAFNNCTGLRDVSMGSGIRTIGNYAFAGTALTSMTMKSGVASIGSSAFSRCTALKIVTIPGTVTSIGSEAFRYAGLTTLTIPGSVTKVGDRAFAECPSLTSVTIQSGVGSIGSEAFKRCSSLAEVTIGSGVNSIGSYAFNECTALKTVTLSDGLKTIGNYAFASTGLTSVAIPGGVTSVGSCAFSRCTAMRTVSIPDTVTEIGTEAFRYAGLTTLTVPGSVTKIGDRAFDECASLTAVTIQSGVGSIGSEAFKRCGSLTEVTIGSGLTAIGSYAFNECTYLKKVTLSDGLKTIGSYAFASTGLTEVAIPGGVTSIGSCAFSRCTAMKTVSLPSTLTELGSEAFRYAGLNTLTIPGSVAKIGDRAFNECLSLTTVTVQSGVGAIGSETFRGCTALTKAVLPASVTTFGSYCFNKCTSLTIYAPTGSPAETYARNQSIAFMAAD